MKLSKAGLLGVCLSGLVLSACSHSPQQVRTDKKPEILIIHPDGSMEFRNRFLPEEDVVIYEDGFGGEKAAIRVRAEPLHPDFFRDTIVVERRTPLDDNTVTQN